MNVKPRLEQALSQYVGLKNAVLFSSCRNALYTLLLSLNVNKDDEIIIQSFICDSLICAIEKAGAKPILVEVDSETFNLDNHLVQNAINSKTKAIIFVHTYGNPSGIEEISGLCNEKNIILIEDIAHALGARYDHKLAGTFGDYAVYSFTKQMVNIGGGAVLSNHNLDEVKKIKHSLTLPSINRVEVYFTYLKRVLASLYETKAFFLSKLLINAAHTKKDLKMVQGLDPHFFCSSLEAYFALRQLPSLYHKIIQRKKNFMFIQERVQTQRIDPKAHSSYNYLSFVFPVPVDPSEIKKAHFLFLPPWSGAKMSSQLLFIPNSPTFRTKTLLSFIEAYGNIYNLKEQDKKNE